MWRVESSCGQDIACPECRNKICIPVFNLEDIQQISTYVGRHKYIGVNTNSKNMCKNIYVNLRTSSLFRFLPDPRKDAPPEMTSDTGQQISTVNSRRRGAAITVKHWPTISRLATHTCSPACRDIYRQTLSTTASNKGSRRFHNHREGSYQCLLLIERAYQRFHI